MNRIQCKNYKYDLMNSTNFFVLLGKISMKSGKSSIKFDKNWCKVIKVKEGGKKM